MLKALLVSFVFVGFLSVAHAQGAQFSVTFVVNGPNATGGSCLAAGAFISPVAPGTVICPITITPSTWSGTLTLGGADASLVAIASSGSGNNLVVGSTALTQNRSYAITITASP